MLGRSTKLISVGELETKTISQGQKIEGRR